MNAVATFPKPKPNSRVALLAGFANTPAELRALLGRRGARAADAAAASRAAPPAPPVALKPLKPAEYLQLRRIAAGLSVEDVATRLAPKERDRTLAAEAIRMWETPGVIVKTADALHALRRAFPFDPGVYRQLAEAPPSRHPSICRGCGCSPWDRCVRDDQAACTPATADRCSCCAAADAGGPPDAR